MSAINTSALALLRRALSPSAALYLPGDAGYSVKRWALNTERPATVVAHPANVQDIVHLLAFAQGKAPYETQSALPFTVKGGAHWFSQDATSNQNHGMVIELNPKMKNVRVDTEAKVAYVEGGCLWADVDEATLKHGLASVAGTVSHVGVGGSTLGGGFGWLTGQHGLVVDNLVEATVVTSTGDVLTASESDNADLFWAIRGGGGNFGVVTEFVIRLHDQRADVYTSTLTFSPSMVEKIVPELNAWLVEREPSENAHLMFVPGASGQPELVLQLVYNGDSATGAKKFERFFKLGPTAARSETIPYGRLNYLQDHHMAAGLNRFIHGNFMPSTTAGVPTTLLSGMFQAWTKFATSNPAAAGSVMILELYHTEKWASVPADATAYANRQPTFNIAYIMSWADPAFTRLAVEETFALDQTITTLRESHFSGHQGGAYTNYVGSANKFTAHQFGDNVARLEAVKTKYDPAGAFGKWFAVSPEEQDTSCTLERAELVCAN